MRSFRVWLTLAGSIIALATVLTIVGVWVGNLKFDFPASADKVTRINTVVAASAYIAAIIAAVFALIAYWQASGRPSLRPDISFLPIYSPDFVATFQPPPPWVNEHSMPWPLFSQDSVLMLERMGSGTTLTVDLFNTTKYAARNPGVRIEFDGLLFNGVPAGWTSVGRWGEWNGLKTIQWDGGTDNIVHGKWTRTLPIVSFNEIAVLNSWVLPALIVTVIADGCSPKEFRLPLKMQVNK